MKTDSLFFKLFQTAPSLLFELEELISEIDQLPIDALDQLAEDLLEFTQIC